MPGWVNSDRREHLPKDWERRRQQRFAIDGYRCTAEMNDGSRCPEPAEECDHINGRDQHDVHRDLRSLCSWHHAKKSSREGAQARARILRRNAQKFRRTEVHPSLLD